MLNGARAFLLTAPHMAIFPGIAVGLLILGLNPIGDGLRDLLDPTMRHLSSMYGLFLIDRAVRSRRV
jgi:peptide/nickel transport system permease protein